jgi:hypothetical protein
VLWSATAGRHPFAIIGSDWKNYVTSADVMVEQSGPAGLTGRYRAVAASKGTFDGYVFDVNTNGTYSLTVNRGGTAADTQSGQRLLAPSRRAGLAAGPVPFAAGTWHTLSDGARSVEQPRTAHGSQELDARCRRSAHTPLELLALRR